MLTLTATEYDKSIKDGFIITVEPDGMHHRYVKILGINPKGYFHIDLPYVSEGIKEHYKITDKIMLYDYTAIKQTLSKSYIGKIVHQDSHDHYTVRALKLNSSDSTKYIFKASKSESRLMEYECPFNMQPLHHVYGQDCNIGQYILIIPNGQSSKFLFIWIPHEYKHIFKHILKI